jgi:hypothetical protein
MLTATARVEKAALAPVLREWTQARVPRDERRRAPRTMCFVSDCNHKHGQSRLSAALKSAKCVPPVRAACGSRTLKCLDVGWVSAGSCLVRDAGGMTDSCPMCI